MSINKNELTKEQIAKAISCETAEELMTVAKAEGYELTKDEAEAYLTELSDFELDSEALTKVAGGGCYTECNRKMSTEKAPTIGIVLLLCTAGIGFGSFYLFVVILCDIMNCMFTCIFCWKRILPIIEVIVVLC